MGGKNVNINTVSSALGVNTKKLQRLLKDEGTSYSEVLDIVRKNLAQRLLTETDIAIASVSQMLDYASDRPFAAAMHRWFGMTPTAYRVSTRSIG